MISSRRHLIGLSLAYTSDIEGRIVSHNEKGNGWTSKFRPWETVHTEFYQSKKEALDREKELKGGQGRKWIREFILHIKCVELISTQDGSSFKS